MTTNPPTLLNSCRYAATAEQARFRIAGRTDLTRSTRVVALDEGAVRIVTAVASAEVWGDARFFAYLPDDARSAAERPLTVERIVTGDDADPLLEPLRPTGAPSPMSAEIAGADVVVMVATSDSCEAGAAQVGQAGIAAGVMTVGLVLPASVEEQATERIVASLRPTAMVLVVSNDDEDLPQILTALRA